MLRDGASLIDGRVWPDPPEKDDVAQSLTPEQEEEAKALYQEFWRLYPHLRNPTDINMPEKAHFLIIKGFERIRLMQQARKQKYLFTRPDEDDPDEG
jgi:hypothetical protein